MFSHVTLARTYQESRIPLFFLCTGGQGGDYGRLLDALVRGTRTG